MKNLCAGSDNCQPGFFLNVGWALAHHLAPALIHAGWRAKAHPTSLRQFMLIGRFSIEAPPSLDHHVQSAAWAIERIVSCQKE
jgi:hypothetical protein